MASSQFAPIELPKTPVEIQDFIPYFDAHPDTPVSETLESFKTFESALRKVYAQQPDHPAVKDGLTNLVPIFSDKESTLKIRARPLSKETVQESEKYIMPLTDEDRKPNGSPAFVSTFKEFQSNFNLFSESSLVDMDFSNIVVAGSAVTTALLPVPEKWGESKRSLREYYHQKIAPASDVDLFIYGLNEEQAIEKIKQIERCVKDSILHETTTIRTKNAITIASQYPTRHVQIVLRLYDSISQIITGFDVDCACVAYNGSQVYASPRAIAAFVTQINTVDLTRRSPSYENRLSKYSHRGFEVYWPLLDRSRIDPTIFERSFTRTLGLSRLLVLERLPKSEERDAYVDQRRRERGRPPVNRLNHYQRTSAGNIKDREEDDVAEWVVEDDVSSYHTCTVPYGEKYNAGKLNRLLYAKDLLLNAEWNKPSDREVNLHRHPCFFGSAEEVIGDCCGCCPNAVTDEEIETAEQESKVYISGGIKFLKDDPGRQEIGSFNPLTADDWTEMAFVGNTARLCQAIVDGDLEHVEDWCSQEGVDINCRDFCGRTPLHLAVSVSTPEIVKCLVDHGARLVARLFDGKTALHLAAARGSVSMIEILMSKSTANAEEEEDKIEAKRAANRAARKATALTLEGVQSAKETSDVEDFDNSDDSESIGSKDSITQDFVKLRIEKGEPPASEDGIDDGDANDPDIYDVDVLAWDQPCSPLHLAIINGHLEAMRCLVQDFGADPLLPVKLKGSYTDNDGILMTLILGMSLPTEKAKEVVRTLIELGATVSQADTDYLSALQCVILKEDKNSTGFLDLILTHDAPASLSIVNAVSGGASHRHNFESPLTTALGKSNQKAAFRLLALGAKPSIEFGEFVKAYLRSNTNIRLVSPEENMKAFKNRITQPIILAAENEMPGIMQELLTLNANPSTLTTTAESILQDAWRGRNQSGWTLLDVVRSKISALQRYVKTKKQNRVPSFNYMGPHLPNSEPERLKKKAEYLFAFTAGTYQYWTAKNDYKAKKLQNKEAWKAYEKSRENKFSEGVGTEEKSKAIDRLIKEFEAVEQVIVAGGGRTFKELHPEIASPVNQQSVPYKIPPPSPWMPAFTFSVPDLDDEKREAYMLLFEAVYKNELDTVKSMTLGPWGSEKSRRPLEVAVKDANGFSPFSLAVCRGHLKLARIIIDIALAQYQPEGKQIRKYRWNLRPDDSDYESDADSNDINIYRELVDDTFTIDIIDAVSDSIRSNVRPQTMVFSWPCKPFRFVEAVKGKGKDQVMYLMEFAVEKDDLALLNFLLQLRAELIARFETVGEEAFSVTRNQNAFQMAIAKGRTGMLREFITRGGFGVPLNELVKTSGIESTEKPKYYQGLNVGGKKRTDWAQAAGAKNHGVSMKEHPPLLEAAHRGNIDSVEWFMSDEPARCYKHWATANKNDERVKLLEQSEGGFEGVITQWLNTRRDLTLHCAILNWNSNDEEDWHQRYTSFIERLITLLPPSHLEKKSNQGLTPLMIATSQRRIPAIKLLIAAGASQLARDKEDRNIMHLLLNRKDDDLKELREILACFDKSAVKQMLLERCKVAPTALTPLALWLENNDSQYLGKLGSLEILKIITEYSDGKDLEMLNGGGDLPVHISIRKGLTSITAHLLRLRPDLLHRENATGRTPLEMASDNYLQKIVSANHGTENNIFRHHNRYYQPKRSIIDTPAKEFASVKEGKADEIQSKKRTYEVCVAVDRELRGPGGAGVKRRLVSLNEANEVARRLAVAKGGSRKAPGERGSESNAVVDEVQEWLD